MKNRKSNIFDLSYIIPVSALVATLVIAPNVFVDPVNLPKLVAVLIFAAISLISFAFSRENLRNLQVISVFRLGKIQIALIVAIILSLLVSASLNDMSPSYQELWGTWGRNNGLLSFVAILLLSFLVLASNPKRIVNKFIRMLYISTYCVGSYAILQALDLDPVKWNQDYLVSTLGNINFVSALFGLCTLVSAYRIFFIPLPTSTRIFEFVLVLGMIAYCLFTGSVQGLLMFVFGCYVISIIKFAKIKISNHKNAFFFAASAIFLIPAFIVFLMLKYYELFTKLINYETLTYRIDYWLAAIRMLEKFPILGVGADSYGDYYTEFRSLQATLRTGPERISNTAHNILLDLGSGYGLLTLFLVALFFLTPFIFELWRILRDKIQKQEDFLLMGLNSAFWVFVLISINQIGIAIWGWLLPSLLVLQNVSTTGNKEHLELREKTGKSKKRVLEAIIDNKYFSNTYNNHWKNRLISYSLRVVSVLLFFISIILSLVASKSEISFTKNSSSGGSLEQLPIIAFNGLYKTDVLMEQSILTLSKANAVEPQALLEYARRLASLNDRNQFAWRTILTLKVTPEAERRIAASRLRELDPLNPNLRAEIEEVESQVQSELNR